VTKLHKIEMINYHILFFLWWQTSPYKNYQLSTILNFTYL